MEKVIVLKTGVAYAAPKTGTNVDTIGHSTNLVDGAIAIYNDKGELLAGNADDNAALLDSKAFQIVWNTDGVIRRTALINRRSVYRFLNEAYQAPVMHKIAIGGTTESTRLPIATDATGHVGIRVADNTYSGQYATASTNATVYKKEYMTAEQVVDKLVEQLNNVEQLPMTAVKVGTAGNFGITIQSQTRGQVLSISISGLIEGAQILTDGTSPSVFPVLGKGVGEDVVVLEKEAEVFFGQGNYREINDRMFTSAINADKNKNYDLITFQAGLDKPYLGETNVKPLYTIAIPTDAHADLEDALVNILQVAIGGAYSTTTGSEPANDNDPIDGVDAAPAG